MKNKIDFLILAIVVNVIGIVALKGTCKMIVAIANTLNI